MPYFTIRKTFLFCLIKLGAEEEAEIGRFLSLLEDSGAGPIIAKREKNRTASGGRPNVNYFNLFAAIVYGFAFGNPSLRVIEDSIAHDIRYASIMEFERPSYRTIANFINEVYRPCEKALFGAVTAAIAKAIGETCDESLRRRHEVRGRRQQIQIRVWKPTAFHKRLSAAAGEAIARNGLIDGYEPEALIRSSTIAKAITALAGRGDPMPEKDRKAIAKSLGSMLAKCLEYESKEEICGAGRDSYYKTDHGATAMCLKSDYYSGLGSNMHAAYNSQILVSGGLVMSYLATQSRSDMNDFIGVVDAFHDMYGRYPKDVCADSGYGSLANWRYLKEKGIGNYVKHQSWEGDASGRYPDCYRYAGGHAIICLWGKEGRPVEIPGRKPKRAGGRFYAVAGCSGCPFSDYCKRFQQSPDPGSKTFEVVEELEELKNEAFANLLSPKGIELRVNRSIQVEGAFGIGKQDQGYTRLRRTGLGGASAEFSLTYLGMNVKKFFRWLRKAQAPYYWKAPDGLPAEEFPKPSAKKLSKRGRKIRDRMREGIRKGKAEQT